MYESDNNVYFIKKKKRKRKKNKLWNALWFQSNAVQWHCFHL